MTERCPGCQQPLTTLSNKKGDLLALLALRSYDLLREKIVIIAYTTFYSMDCISRNSLIFDS
jgi:hypothetical protein